MNKTMTLSWILVLILCIISTTAPVYSQSQSYFTTSPWLPKEEKVITNIYFFLHGTIGGENATAVTVARSDLEVNVNNDSSSSSSTVPLGSIAVIDSLLTTGSDPNSDLIGNCQGLEAYPGQDPTSAVVLLDFGFTNGNLSDSSISIFSRNPTTQKDRELAVVGGRGKFRRAKGFAILNTYYVDNTSLIVEFNVTVIHYKDNNNNNNVTSSASSFNNPAAGFHVSFYLSSLMSFLCPCLFLFI